MKLSNLLVAGSLIALASPARAADRIVAVGDLHADLTRALAVLEMAGVVDHAGRWAMGADTFVQTGDLMDRGPDGRAVLELMQRLESEAAAAGGAVVSLAGNHEVMNLTGDWRYVSAADVEDFGSVDARRAALAPQAPLGRWLRGLPAVVELEHTVFVHGGLRAASAALGLQTINDQAHAAILQGRGDAPVLGRDGPFWFRGYLLQDEATACAELDRALAAVGATRMIVGHTVQADGHVAARCEGRLLGIDTGISQHYGAHLAAIELLDGDAWAIYPDGRVDLPDP